MDVPELAGNNSKQWLRDAIRRVKELSGTAKDKADLFEAFAKQIEQRSSGSWAANRGDGEGGAFIFIGRMISNFLVIAPDGKIYKGDSFSLAFGIKQESGKLIYVPKYRFLKEI